MGSKRIEHFHTLQYSSMGANSLEGVAVGQTFHPKAESQPKFSQPPPCRKQGRDNAPLLNPLLDILGLAASTNSKEVICSAGMFAHLQQLSIFNVVLMLVEAAGTLEKYTIGCLVIKAQLYRALSICCLHT